MIRRFSAAILAAGLSSLPSLAVPPAVGTVSDDVGYTRGTDFNGSNYQTLTQRRLSDHSDTVLAIVFATPW